MAERYNDGKRSIGRSQRADQLAAAPEFAGRLDPSHAGVRVSQFLLGRTQQLGGAVQVTPPCALVPDCDALQDFSFQCRTQSFDVFELAGRRGPFELCNCRDAQLLVELEHLLRPQPRDAKHIKHPCRYFLAHRFERGMRSCAVEARDDVRDGRTHAGQVAQAIFGNNPAICSL